MKNLPRSTSLSALLSGVKVTLLAAGIALIAGCGGGGGGGTAAAPSAGSPPPATTGSSPTTPPASTPPSASTTADVIVGRITGFGSVYIDGKRFRTESAEFRKSDDNASQSDLRIGMVVEVRGSIDDGTARSVRFEEDIKGPVDAVGAGELTVLGQRVVIAPDTRFDTGLSLQSIQAGDILEVSGLRGANDELTASYIEDKTGDTINAFKVIGTVRQLDSNARTFRVGSLVVDYSAARLDDGLTLANGRQVEVKDESRAYSAGMLRLVATRIERAGVGLDNNGNIMAGRTRLEGLIATVIDGTSFTINGTTVRHDATTTFLFGTAANIGVGSKVQVEGSRQADGRITAVKIKFSNNAARVEGLVENVDASTGRLMVFGVDVRLSAGVRLDDKRDDVEPFSVNDLRRGDFVEVRGSSTENSLFATELRRDDQSDTRLRGPATSISPTQKSLKILGIQVITNASTQYEGFADEQLTADAFFRALADQQTLVEAKWQGTVSDATVAARELSLED